MKGDGVKVNRNAQSSDLAINLQNFVQQLQKFAKGVPNHWGVPNHCDTAPTPYVQDAIFNPPDPYIGSTTVLPDIQTKRIHVSRLENT